MVNDGLELGSGGTGDHRCYETFGLCALEAHVELTLHWMHGVYLELWQLCSRVVQR